MKKLLLISVLCLTTLLINAQDVYQWSEEQIITDTNSNYSNPMIIPFYSDVWMFYQKNEDYSSIMKMDMAFIEDTVSVLSDEGINYGNPYFVFSSNPSYLGFLFYLSDEDGYVNLYASKYYEGDSLGGHIRITSNPAQTDISDYNMSENGFISFTIDSIVYAAELKFYQDSVYTERLRVLDSSSSSIKIKYYQAAWEKPENGEIHIYQSDYIFNADTADFVWSEPYYADSVGNSSELTVSNAVFGWGDSGFCWIKNDTINVLSGDVNYKYLETVTTFSMPDVRQITMVNWDIAVKQTYFLAHYTAFTTGLEANSEIFCSMGEFGWEDSAFISNNNHPDENPRLFFGESFDGWGTEAYYVYCIWQSEINGNLALSMSKAKAFIGSSLDELKSVDNFMKVSPNPFRNKINIKVNTHSGKADLTISDMQAKTLFYHPDIQTNNAWDEFFWVPDPGLKNGAYIINLKIGAKQYSYKILLLK
jgi:hypothetical protein